MVRKFIVVALMALFASSGIQWLFYNTSPSIGISMAAIGVSLWLLGQRFMAFMFLDWMYTNAAVDKPDGPPRK